MVRRSLRIALAAAAAWTLWALFGYWMLRTRQRHHVEAAWFILTALALAASTAYGGGRAALDNTRARGADVWLFVSVGASLLLYLPAIGLGLLSDDYVLLARSVSDVLNPGAWEHFRPLPLLVWKLLYLIGGPSVLHAFNIVLHGVNAWLLWRFSLRLGHPASVAAFVAVVFLFFPAAVEPVAWNSGIFDVATVFFGLLFLHGIAARGAMPRALGLMALVGAMLSKETAVVLPLIALALAWRIRFDPRTLATSIVLAATYALVRVVSGTAPVTAVVGVDRPFRYALKETLVRPFATLGAPWTVGELQLQSQALVFGVLPAAVVIAFIVRHCVRSGSLRSVSHVAWVVLATAPLGGFMFVNDELQGSRYLYLPLCGWSLFLGDLVNDRENRRVRIARVLLLVSAVVLGTWGVRAHLEPWREAAALREQLLGEARRVLAATSCSSVAFENVPDVHDGAAQLFRNGFDEAVRDIGVRGHGPRCRFVWTGVHFEEVETSQR
jgi:hypothetical protein